MARTNWLSAVSGDFDDASNWFRGIVPGALRVAVIAAPGADFTVSSFGPQRVDAVSLAANATLAVQDGDFDALSGGLNAGFIDVAPGEAAFEAAGVLDNSGVMELDQKLGGAPGATLIVDSGGLTLKGGGEIFLDNPNVWTNTRIPAPPGYSTDLILAHVSTTLTNVDNTIYGAGQIGHGPLRVVNESHGVIDANLTFDLLMRDVDGGIENDGLMESTGSGGLYVVSSTVNQGPGGVIAANGGIVYFSYADIAGGTLSSSGTGRFFWDHGLTTLDGTQGRLTNNAHVFVSDGAKLGLEGFITNNSEFEVGTGREASTVVIGAAAVQLGGDGVILLGGHNPATAIKAAAPGTKLVNLGNTIEGHGVIGGGGLNLINDGTVDASVGDPLAIVGHVVNAGILEATGFGGLKLSARVDNAGGTILADTRVTLVDANVVGGTLSVSGSLKLSGNDSVSAAVLGAGRLIEAGGRAVLTNAGGFAGHITLRGGALSISGLATTGAEGTAAATTGVVIFADPATLSIGDALAPGSTLPTWLTDFDARGDRLDLTGVAFVSGATAVLSGSVLTLREGGEAYNFNLSGRLASAFVVESDGHGGTLIKPRPASGAVGQSAVASASAAHPLVYGGAGATAAVGGDVHANAATAANHGGPADPGLSDVAGDHPGASHDPFLIENRVGAAGLDAWLSGHLHLTQTAELASDWMFH